VRNLWTERRDSLRAAHKRERPTRRYGGPTSRSGRHGIAPAGVAAGSSSSASALEEWQPGLVWQRMGGAMAVKVTSA
jgi:hypothetical protein